MGYSGKALGNTSLSFGTDAEANFAKFTANFPDKTVYDMPGEGKDKIVTVDGKSPEEISISGADALVTKNKLILLTLRAADCIPLVFYGKDLLALAHVGTSGAALHIPAKVVKMLDVEPSSLSVYVGPYISQKSYRFEEDKFEKKLDPSWDRYITHEADGVHINLLGYVTDELKACGIKEENIEIEDIDTGSNPNYFSHRRHKLTGEPDGRNCFGVTML